MAEFLVNYPMNVVPRLPLRDEHLQTTVLEPLTVEVFLHRVAGTEQSYRVNAVLADFGGSRIGDVNEGRIRCLSHR